VEVLLPLNKLAVSSKIENSNHQDPPQYPSHLAQFIIHTIVQKHFSDKETPKLFIYFSKAELQPTSLVGGTFSQNTHSYSQMLENDQR
jgi:hypothetical protein